MATTQLLDGSIRICKDTSPNPLTEWKLEITANDGTRVALGLNYPLREFMREVLADYPDDEPAYRPFPLFDDDVDEDLGDEEHPVNCTCCDCEDYHG